MIGSSENGKSKIENGIVTLKVYNIHGQEIATLVNERLYPGTYEIPFSINQFSNNRLASGIYFYKTEAGNLGSPGQVYRETKKMILIK